MLIKNWQIFLRITISVLYLMSILTRKNFICDSDFDFVMLPFWRNVCSPYLIRMQMCDNAN